MKKKPKIRLPDFNELTKRISFVDVLGHYNLLCSMDEKGDQLRGVCPIHEGAKNKKSFSVSAVKNCYRCFSCGSKGNILSFVAGMENCNKFQAGRFLEKWFPAKGSPSADGGEVAGKNAETMRGDKRVQDPQSLHSGQSFGGQGKKKGVGGEYSLEEKSSIKAVNPPLKFFLRNLETKDPYLLGRVLPKTIERFGLGVCGVGLMKGRVVVPIHNECGQLVAYAGRWPSDENIPENEGKYKFPTKFKKGYVLFNLHRVLEAVKNGEPLILVEGFFDVFRLYELGFTNVVALMGSSLTNEQEDLLKSILTPLSPRVVLLFDNDTAGLACVRDVATRLSAWCFIKIAKLPAGITQPDQLKERIEIF